MWSAVVKGAIPREKTGVRLDGLPRVRTAVGAGCASGCRAGHGWAVKARLGRWVVTNGWMLGNGQWPEG